MRFQMNPKKFFFFNYRNVKQYISEEQVYTKKQKEPNKNQQNRKSNSFIKICTERKKMA